MSSFVTSVECSKAFWFKGFLVKMFFECRSTNKTEMTCSNFKNAMSLIMKQDLFP